MTFAEDLSLCKYRRNFETNKTKQMWQNERWYRVSIGFFLTQSNKTQAIWIVHLKKRTFRLCECVDLFFCYFHSNKESYFPSNLYFEASQLKYLSKFNIQWHRLIKTKTSPADIYFPFIDLSRFMKMKTMASHMFRWLAIFGVQKLFLAKMRIKQCKLQW